MPDNLRSAVTRGSRYDTVLNDEFAAFAEHYATTVIPARAYKPRDKSLVEGAVKLIYRSIYNKLDNSQFETLEQLNSAIAPLLEIHNNKTFSGRNYSRREQFEEIKLKALAVLNPVRYKVHKQVMVTVMRNGHVRLGEMFTTTLFPITMLAKR